jgi:hypothetical protein
MNRNGKGNGRGDRSSKRSSDEIRRDIDHTRHAMDATLDELYERLHPVHLFNDLLGYATQPQTRLRMRSTALSGRRTIRRARESAVRGMDRAGYAARRTGRSARTRARALRHDVWRGMRENPLPALMVAAGVGLYLWRRRRAHTRWNEDASGAREESTANRYARAVALDRNMTSAPNAPPWERVRTYAARTAQSPYARSDVAGSERSGVQRRNLPTTTGRHPESRGY